MMVACVVRRISDRLRSASAVVRRKRSAFVPSPSFFFLRLPTRDLYNKVLRPCGRYSLPLIGRRRKIGIRMIYLLSHILNSVLASNQDLPSPLFQTANDIYNPLYCFSSITIGQEWAEGGGCIGLICLSRFDVFDF